MEQEFVDRLAMVIVGLLAAALVMYSISQGGKKSSAGLEFIFSIATVIMISMMIEKNNLGGAYAAGGKC